MKPWENEKNGDVNVIMMYPIMIKNQRTYPGIVQKYLTIKFFI